MHIYFGAVHKPDLILGSLCLALHSLSIFVSSYPKNDLSWVQAETEPSTCTQQSLFL